MNHKTAHQNRSEPSVSSPLLTSILRSPRVYLRFFQSSPLAFPLVIGYFLTAILWVVITDFALGLWVANSEDMVIWQSAKGIGFVAVTGCALYMLVQHAESRIDRLTRLYGVLSSLNIAITRIRRPDALYREATRILVDRGRFKTAWVMLIDSHAEVIRPVAIHGIDGMFAEAFSISLHNDRALSGSFGKALRNGRYAISADIQQDPDLEYWRPLANAYGLRASAAFPLRINGEVIGLLCCAVESPLQMSDEEINLLTAYADDLAFAIEASAHERALVAQSQALVEAYDTTLAGWSAALDMRDRETDGHSRRVTEMAVALAEKIGITDEELVHIRRGALLHDIGKIGIPDRILHKQGPLNEEEWAVMRQHPTRAYELLQSIAYLQPALAIPFCHHERWDGTGYPRGLKGEEIPLAARIFAVVDVWDALLSHRPYRVGWPIEQQQAAGYRQRLGGLTFEKK